MDTKPATIAGILEREAVKEDPELLAEQRAELALSRLLQRGFAQTPTAQAAVERIFEEPAFMLDAPGWLDEMEERAMLVQLNGPAPHTEKRRLKLAFDIPLADHALIDVYIEHFTGRGRWFFAKWLARADRYLPIMQPILREAGVPEDLVYVAMIESGFSAKAISIAAACGYWQFIRSTGKMYGLRQDFWVDERRDFERSTQAAAAYMKQLRKQFGDWHLAWAGYNAGGGRVSRAMKKYGIDNYWTMVDRKQGLVKETRHYVPKILAAAIIAKHRVAYGFGDVESLPPLEYDTLTVDDAVHLMVIAKRIGVGINTLRELNPALLQDVTPPGRKWALRVPKGHGDKVTAWLTDLPTEKRVTYRHHKVRKGDTLWKIAQRYGTTITAVREFNGIRNPRSLSLGKSLIIPAARGKTNVASRPAPPKRKAAAKVASRAPAPAKRAARTTPSKPTRVASASHGKAHVVSAGETLWSIAQRYGISVDRLKKWNNRRSNVIVVGETLSLR